MRDELKPKIQAANDKLNRCLVIRDGLRAGRWAVAEVERLCAKLADEVAELQAARLALSNLFDACMAADADGELDSRINGELLDAAMDALPDLTEKDGK